MAGSWCGVVVGEGRTMLRLCYMLYVTCRKGWCSGPSGTSLYSVKTIILDIWQTIPYFHPSAQTVHWFELDFDVGSEKQALVY